MYIYFTCKELAPPDDDKNQKGKFTAAINYQGLINEQEFIKLWRRSNHMPELQAMTHCLSFQYTLKECLLESKIVRFSLLGNVYPTFKSDIVDDPRKVNEKIIKDLTVNLKPNKYFESEMRSSLHKEKW